MYVPEGAWRRIARRVGSSAALLQSTSAGVAALLVLATMGCGNNYRPVVTAINPVGPAAQPAKYAVAISNPTATGAGLVTFVDFSGDTILNTTAIGNAPYYLALDVQNQIGASATTGYTLNGDGTINIFTLSPSSLLSNAVQSATLLSSSSLPTSIFAGGTGSATNVSSVYVTEPGRSAVAQFTSSPPALRQELPVGANPVYIAGISGAPRLYAISRGSGSGAGSVSAIENTASNVSISNTIGVGVNPVYGVMTTDGRRAFIMNQGSGTVTAINAQTNTLDQTAPTITVGTSPVWADLVQPRAELAVLNAGAAGSTGSVSVINIPLCNNTAQASNPNCSSSNPVDAAGFGQVIATVPVGTNPSVLSVLQDGTRAYVANTGATGNCNNVPGYASLSAALQVTNGCGTVSVVNLNTMSVTATIDVVGHPTFIVATTGTPTGKVYVTSTESRIMTVIRTDIDQVQTLVDLQGRGGQVRVTQP